MALVVARGRFKGSYPEPLEQKSQRDEAMGNKWNAPSKLVSTSKVSGKMKVSEIQVECAEVEPPA